jgi:hypothetical protein
MHYYMGDVDVGDYVLYFRDGDTSRILDYKKDIWKVEEMLLSGSAEIRNIAKNSSFTTNINNLIDVKIILQKYKIEDIISKRSIAKWGTFKQDFGYKAVYEDPNWDKEFVGYIKEDNLVYEDNFKTGEVKMNMMSKVIDNNVNAAKAGAVISAGNTLNKVVKNSIRSQVPRKYRKVVDSALGDVLVANVASFAVQNFAKTNYKALIATDAMMQAAMVEVLNSFNLDQMIADVLDKVNLDEILDTTGE